MLTIHMRLLTLAVGQSRYNDRVWSFYFFL